MRTILKWVLCVGVIVTAGSTLAMQSAAAQQKQGGVTTEAELEKAMRENRAVRSGPDLRKVGGPEEQDGAKRDPNPPRPTSSPNPSPPVAPPK